MLSEAQLKSIIRYLDDELSVEEEMLFIRQLCDNNELEKAFDLELILRARRNEEVIGKDDITSEPADKFSERAGKTATTNSEREEYLKVKTPVVTLWNKAKIASVAAAVILIVLALIFYYFNQNKEKKLENKVRQSEYKSINYQKYTVLNASFKNNTAVLPDNNFLSKIKRSYYKR